MVPVQPSHSASRSAYWIVIIRTASAIVMAVAGVSFAYLLTALNGWEREERGWSWGAESVYLVLLAVWCVAAVLLAHRKRGWRPETWLAPGLVGAISVTGWVIVLLYAFQHPK